MLYSRCVNDTAIMHVQVISVARFYIAQCVIVTAPMPIGAGVNEMMAFILIPGGIHISAGANIYLSAMLAASLMAANPHASTMVRGATIFVTVMPDNINDKGKF